MIKPYYKALVLGVAMFFSEQNLCYSQDSEVILNEKYWTMRERFRKYFISIGKADGQGIPAAQRQAGNRCGALYPNSSGWLKWGDATSYLGDYMCTLSTEYALLSQQGKDTKATLNELYYALNAIERLDGIAEKTFDNNIINNNYNGFFIRDDVQQSTLSYWNTEYTNTGGFDAKLNYQCLGSDREINLDNDTHGNSCTNEVSQDQLISLFQGFMFIKKYVPNVYVKPTSTDAGFNILDKMKQIASRMMDYVSGSDINLLRPDHASEFLYNQVNPANYFFASPGLGGSITSISSCADNDVRSNWVLVNPITGRKVGSCSNDTKSQDIRPFAYAIAKTGEMLTGNTYLNRDIHHKVVDQAGDGYYCMDVHDYHIPLSWIKTHVWEALELAPHFDDEFAIAYPDIAFQKKPVSFIVKGITAQYPFQAYPRNSYMMEALAAISDSWSHQNVTKFSNYYHHENMDLVFACLNNTIPRNSQSHYINLLSKLSCDGPHNYGQSDYTSFWNNGSNFEQPNPNDIIDPAGTYSQGDYNANDWMWLYNMYRLKFGDNSFPVYEDNTCNCKKSPTLENNTNPVTGMLTNNVTLKRVFSNYLKLGISLKEYNQGPLYIQNSRILTNETELVICGQVYISGSGQLINAGRPNFDDSIKTIVRSGSNITLLNDGTLDIGQNSKIILQKNATLKTTGTNARIIVRNGAKLILEPNSLLELNNGGKLIVEDGGQVIIQSDLTNPNANINALFIYQKGAIIELNGNNAVLELNGCLLIGNDATFSIAYPSGNSGYIKFNRGNVWWNNWAPGNAHIACGTNAKINLIGQGRTDKLIEINQMNVAMPKNLARFDITTALVEFNAPSAMLETNAPGQMLACSFKGLPSLIGGTIPVNQYTRGLLMFGQAGFKVAGCDFVSLGYGITGALFYGGNKLNVITSNFKDNYTGIYTIGAGSDVTQNKFTNNSLAISCTDITLNTGINNNIISANLSDMQYYGSPADPMGISAEGSVGNVYITQNDISKTGVAVFGTNANLNLKCNNLQGNSLALFGNTNSNNYMSTLLNSGNNNASNCYQFASFNDAKSWEPYLGYNSFKITNTDPCTVRYVGTLHQLVTVCPTITDGTLVQTNSLAYQHLAGSNYWLTPANTNNYVESEYNQLKKTSNYWPINVVTNSALTNQTLVDCQIVGPPRVYLENLSHPLDPGFASIVIHTSSFPESSLQSALFTAITLKNDTTKQNHLDGAANLFQEILGVEYSASLDNGNRYLLELAWQQFLETVSQLKEREISKYSLLVPLSERFTKLFELLEKRISREPSNVEGYNKIIDILKIDKALIYRLAENREAAISQLNELASSEMIGAQYRNLCNYLICTYAIEKDAIDQKITLEELFTRLNTCHEEYISQLVKPLVNSARKSEYAEANTQSSMYNLNVLVYPNPGQNHLIIDYDLKKYTAISFEIEDMQGNKVASYKLNAENSQFIIEHLNLESGMYIYKIRADNQSIISQKLIIMR